jgi:hypothetical protein
MRLLFLALIVVCPMLTASEVTWHDFVRSLHEKETIDIGHISMTIEEQKDSRSYFPSDDLVITVRQPGRDSSQLQFTASYGDASVAIYGNMLLLKYGVGRGTAGGQVKHIKVLRLDDTLDELVDVQSSYWIVTNPHNVSPDEFDYQLKVQIEGDYTTFIFSLPKPRYGLPAEKIVRIRK